MRRRLERRAESSERIDDNPDTVLKRLKTFKENNAPVIEHLEKRESVYQVSEQIKLRLYGILTRVLG